MGAYWAEEWGFNDCRIKECSLWDRRSWGLRGKWWWAIQYYMHCVCIFYFTGTGPIILKSSNNLLSCSIPAPKQKQIGTAMIFSPIGPHVMYCTTSFVLLSSWMAPFLLPMVRVLEIIAWSSSRDYSWVGGYHKTAYFAVWAQALAESVRQESENDTLLVVLVKIGRLAVKDFGLWQNMVERMGIYNQQSINPISGMWANEQNELTLLAYV